ncbi:hypothetical protein F751_6168 [Auxenochlorella protothecoides]|uniref:Uncharacterized protein n=2 Tax=Auxenochlorella protothecoides TaxID=3075 RepID=A0A087SHK9_AUXPR|nr:hypothetical protein F751_6168 [Auxenochlorella protothecoides]KFM25213.1 hypothetical protein F751_6168 [Auxenochlorella protothecoides]
MLAGLQSIRVADQIRRALALENEELMDKVVLQALRGVRDGRGEDADFVAFLMSCEDACVQAACLRTKLLLRVVRLLDSAGHNALRALRTLSPDQLRKFSLFDGPALLSQGLAEGTLDPASAVPVLAAACRAQPDCLTQLASAPRARALAGLVGETAVPAGTQAAAAALLADLAFRPEASPACLELLINEALPRACEARHLLRAAGEFAREP